MRSYVTSVDSVIMAGIDFFRSLPGTCFVYFVEFQICCFFWTAKSWPREREHSKCANEIHANPCDP